MNMQEKTMTYIRTLKILQSVSEFTGLRIHKIHEHALKVSSLQPVKVGHYVEEDGSE